MAASATMVTTAPTGPGLFDPRIREGLLGRLDGLDPAARPRWGRLTPHAAVCHLLDCVAITFAEVDLGWRPGFWSSAAGRWLVIRSPLPWPRGLSAPDFLLRTEPGDWAEDHARLRAGVERFAENADERWGISPLFGPLSGAEFALLNARHLDHHLGQFGV